MTNKKVELEFLVEKLRKKVLQSPEKTAKLLTNWINKKGDSKKENPQRLRKKVG